ncbi:hypothetical protein NDU88_001664 [Pleurodeles waltl]|uniref:Uncharacterized protein n=1 Tax=Pleurodeles waltl TaxID=8319 RepID=A0AAV7VX23_PLEWA|nr:hypothetical protein NDU88_001664 [Pleurodeles waltl]
MKETSRNGGHIPITISDVEEGKGGQITSELGLMLVERLEQPRVVRKHRTVLVCAEAEQDHKRLHSIDKEYTISNLAKAGIKESFLFRELDESHILQQQKLLKVGVV